jgi:hydroxyacylglutathione hydrolase
LRSILKRQSKMSIEIKSFVFSPFQENTYVLWDETKECIIFDPGCYEKQERDELSKFIRENQLNPVRLINTHCHLDHVFGNGYVASKYGLTLEAHEGEIPVLASFLDVCRRYGIPEADPSPVIGKFIEDGDTIEFGTTKLKAMLTPGHSPASLSFYCETAGLVIAGDVLFHESIGRTDLPGGNFDTLMKSIRNRLFLLPDETIVYSGHGPTTTIRHEKEYNPFL